MTTRSLFGSDPAPLPDAQLQRARPRARMARATDPATSHQAAAQHVASGANAAQCAAVLLAVAEHPGWTSDELAAPAKLDRYAVARRLADLERDGLVRKGVPRTSRVGGRKCVTWFAAASRA